MTTASMDQVWTSRKPHGFMVSVARGDAEWIVAARTDDFSTAKVVSHRVTVLVQGGVLSEESARRLLSLYLSNPGSFDPPRNTDGSFVLIDTDRRRMWAGRDRSQAFHLYWTECDATLYLSTSQLPLCGTVCRELDAAACDMYLVSGIVIAPMPLLRGLRAVLPGHACAWQGSGPPKETIFWSIQRTGVPDAYDAAVERYGELLLDNIHRHVRSDSAGLFLSGGSDSAAVAGALHKLGVRNKVALHMEVGNMPAESEDVAVLARAYSLNFQDITPPETTDAWMAEIDASLVRNQPGSYISFPMYARMGRTMGRVLPAAETVFNGEMCLLDQGFNVTNDRWRGVRRWLYMGSGRRLATFGLVWPQSWDINWEKCRRVVIHRKSIGDHLFVARTAATAFLHAIGRSNEYYLGVKLGFRGFPGPWRGLSFLPRDYSDSVMETLRDRFLCHYEAGLRGSEWRQTFATMNTCWYSESSNFTMPLDAAAEGRHPICFPFSSVDLMDYAASLPLDWCRDKRIQKDMCARFLNMPEKTAYRLKDHTLRRPYEDIVYGRLNDTIRERVAGAEWGPLSGAIRAMKAGSKWKRTAFNFYALYRLVSEYGLCVR